ncbi:hypothetical protein SELMODRAFT_172178 [Selaginella moellendorffii]|uniref:Tocopherol cyclase n=1 Tax=Selaginella moellendorffii TaxID=88036 RepID=D8RKD2_SELML|nr:probable tocopherol cyclase, chloroplastic [Selaginella moellendorffii]XP_024532019.1 probable tocopherol cyclase, chloroplastic [Selaginella moellendorffii]EFJ27422.1 hypothetical protein SELMODRAFT_172178 [Selaginella moellendorffii]|eukprot:XP_002971673.1 probable tocopherol cyclase, chloroplastic [Selaginella moellendorffii]
MALECSVFASHSSMKSGLRSLAVRSSHTAVSTTASQTSHTAIRTPHSGYHFDGSSRRFMEGWYFKVALPDEKQSFAWMYSIEDPAFSESPSGIKELVKGPRFPGMGAQVLGPNDEYLFQFQDTTRKFWASPTELALGGTFASKKGSSPPRSLLPSQEFDTRVEEGFQVDAFWHQGFLRDNGRSPKLNTVDSVRWEYSTRPLYGWGNSGSGQKATAGWLAAFPVFEPHWQICMAHGLSTGWIQWGEKRYEFEDVPSYVEKNWGGTFPEKWFWVQCNVFEGSSGDVALTSGGGKRGLPFPPGSFEEVAMVGVHHAGKFYEFVPWAGEVEWEITPWGSWKIAASTIEYEVLLEATTDTPGTVLRAPTRDGLVPICQDTFDGKLKLQIWERSVNGVRGKLVLDVTSEMAALEVGGGPWYTTWKKKSRMAEPLRSLVGLQLDLESIFSSVPALKPPGL